MVDIHLRIRSLLGQKKWSEALLCYLEEIQANKDVEYPQRFDLNFLAEPLRYVQLSPEQLSEIIHLARLIVEQQPTVSSPYILLGDLLARKHQIDKAINCYQIALEYKYSGHGQLFPNSNVISGKPDFLIIGAAKCGTTSLYHYIVQHPQIFAALKKEIDFFQKYFERGIDWYKAHFPNLNENPSYITGEASPGYFPECYEIPIRIYAAFPNIKLILIIRNPVDRTISHYFHNTIKHSEHRSISQVIKDEISLLKAKESAAIAYRGKPSGQPGYLLISFYLGFIKKWFEIFQRENILILKAEDLYSNPEETTNKVFDFLGVDRYKLKEYKNHLPGSYDSSDIESARDKLRDIFENHNKNLEKYLDASFDW